MAKSRACRSRCCGLALIHGLVLYIGLTSLQLPPLDRLAPEISYVYVMYVRLNPEAYQEKKRGKRVNASKKPYS